MVAGGGAGATAAKNQADAGGGEKEKKPNMLQRADEYFGKVQKGEADIIDVNLPGGEKKITIDPNQLYKGVTGIQKRLRTAQNVADITNTVKNTALSAWQQSKNINTTPGGISASIGM